jgi:hypothetical protein
VRTSVLPAAGTGRVQPRRAADRAGTGRLVLFFKIVSYSSHTRARRRYTGTTGTGTGKVRRVRDFFCCFLNQI